MSAATDNVILQMAGSTECSHGSCRQPARYAYRDAMGVWPLCDHDAALWQRFDDPTMQQCAYRIALEYAADAVAFTTACCTSTVVQHLWQPRALVGIFACLRCRRMAYCLGCTAHVTPAVRAFFRPLLRCSEHAGMLTQDTLCPIAPVSIKDHQMVIKIAQHSLTKRFQPWMALQSDTMTTFSLLSSHRTLAAARQVVMVVSAAMKRGASIDIPTLIETSGDGDVPDPLPYADMAVIQSLIQQVMGNEASIADLR